MKIMIIIGCLVAAAAVILGVIEKVTGKNVTGRKFRAGEDPGAECQKEGSLLIYAGVALAVTCLSSGEIFFPKYFNVLALIALFWTITQLTSWGRSSARRAAEKENLRMRGGTPEDISKYNHGKKIK